MHSIRIVDIGNEGQGCWRFWWKLAGQPVLTTGVCTQENVASRFSRLFTVSQGLSRTYACRAQSTKVQRTRAAPRRGPRKSKQTCHRYPLHAHFYSITKKLFDLESDSQRHSECNIHSGVIRRRRVTSAKGIWRMFTMALTVSDCFRFVTLKN